MNNKWMVDLAVDRVLVVDVIDLLRLDDVALVQQLQSEVLASLLVFGYLDLTEATYIVRQYIPLPRVRPI
jgi:hypothetical protein